MPGTDELWAVVNNRDNIAGARRPRRRRRRHAATGASGSTAYVDDHPVEPFIRVVEGGFYGWPFCNPNSDKGNRDDAVRPRLRAQPRRRRADCAKATPIDVGIQAHSAPLGLTFTQGTTAPDLGAVIALHGSWNRSTPTGYKVIHFPWTAAGPGEQLDLVTGWRERRAAGGAVRSTWPSTPTGRCWSATTAPAP